MSCSHHVVGNKPKKHLAILQAPEGIQTLPDSQLSLFASCSSCRLPPHSVGVLSRDLLRHGQCGGKHWKGVVKCQARFRLQLRFAALPVVSSRMLLLVAASRC